MRPARALFLTALSVALLAQLAQARPSGAPLGRRELLQGAPNGSGGANRPKTAAIVNINTDGDPVFCVNVTLPFVNQTYSASGSSSQSGGDVADLAALICADPQAAGRQLYQAWLGGGEGAEHAAQSLKQTNCTNDPNRVPNAVTAASVMAQDSAASVQDVEIYFRNVVVSLDAVGVPACVTLLESDSQGQIVATERYYKTGG